MKVDIIRKFKWYIVGFIMIVIMLAVGLSFCTWDDLSIKQVNAVGNTGNYKVYTLAEDRYKDNVGNKGANGEVNVGDIVEYGRFWQQANAEGVNGLEAHRWIVANIDANKATLLSEKVVVYGNFWGSTQYYQNYYQSTLRSWLNSGKGSLKGTETNWSDTERYNDNTRSDGIKNDKGDLIKFGINEPLQVNKGFLDVAFNDTEKSILVPNRIEGMQGFGINNNSGTIHEYTIGERNYINDLVWIPSWQEIFGTKENPWSGMTLRDGTPNTKLSYFDDVISYSGVSPNQCWISSKAIAAATEYAWNAAKNSYYNNGGGFTNAYKHATWWWLRSPNPSSSNYSLVIDYNGNGSDSIRVNPSSGGVRPAVCIQL